MKIIYNPKKPTMSFKYKGHRVTVTPCYWGDPGNPITLDITVNGKMISYFQDCDDESIDKLVEMESLNKLNFNRRITKKREVSEDLCELIAEAIDEHLEIMQGFVEYLEDELV